MNIYEKLQDARVQLQSKQIKKSGKNNYSGFTYYELADILPEINKIFKVVGLCSNFSIVENKAILTIFDTESDSKIEFISPTAEAQLKGCTEIQSLGAVHTYLKRYLYMNALEIVENDALDSLAGSDKIEEIPDNDLDIIAGIASLNTSKEISDYFNAYNKQVKNKSQFIIAINKRRKEITEG